MVIFNEFNWLNRTILSQGEKALNSSISYSYLFVDRIKRENIWMEIKI